MKQNLKYNKNVKKEKVIKNIDIISVPLYRCKITLLFGKNAKQLETDWDYSYDYGGQARNYLNEDRAILISFPDSNPKISNVVHELCHATQMILKNAGHDYHKQEADEPFAYLLTFLIEEYLKIKKPK